MDLSDQRMPYEAERIDFDSLPDDPIIQFATWFGEAQASAEPEAYAMVVSTVDADGWPTGRTVLLRQFDKDGFVFYTNYESAKGQALDATGRAGLTFYWASQHRQIHVSGEVSRLREEESDAYFAKRPRESQLGAWASDQSAELSGREELEERLEEVTALFEGRDVDRPGFWGGYRVVPRWIEFWQGQPNRLHDRIRYIAEPSRNWRRAILNP